MDMHSIKAPIRQFLRQHYSDDKLAQLLAHARSGQLAYHSCCCFIGTVTAKGKLRPYDAKSSYDWSADRHAQHYDKAKDLEGAWDAEKAFCKLVTTDHLTFIQLANGDYDSERRRLLIPILRAEQWRRQHIRLKRRKLNQHTKQQLKQGADLLLNPQLQSNTAPAIELEQVLIQATQKGAQR